MTVADVARFPGALEARRGDGALGRRRAAGDARRCSTQALDAPRAMRAGRGRAAARGARGRARGDRSRDGAHRGALASSARGAPARALLERVRALLAELGLEERRLYQEVVRAVERHDVAEELQRLRSHVAAGARADRGNGALRQAPRLPGAGADARGQHHRQQGGRGSDRAGAWSGSRARSSASASRCRTLSERAAQRDRGLGALRAPARPRCWRACCARCDGLRFSVSHTTRPPRSGEKDGVDYHFVDARGLRAAARRGQAARVGRGPRQPLRHRARGDRRGARARAWTCCSTSTCRAPRRCASASPDAVTRLHPAALVRRRSSSGCAAAARTTRRRSRGAWQWRAARARPSRQYDYAVVNDDFDTLRATDSRSDHPGGALPGPAVAEPRRGASCRTFETRQGDENAHEPARFFPRTWTASSASSPWPRSAPSSSRTAPSRASRRAAASPPASPCEEMLAETVSWEVRDKLPAHRGRRAARRSE